MRKRFALSVVSIGVLVACGPHDVDLGGGSGGAGAGGDGSSTGGAGGSFTTGGAYATGGSGAVGGSDSSGGVGGGPAQGVCGDLILDEGEECDDGNPIGGDGCTGDCRLELGAAGGAGGSDGSGGYGGIAGGGGVGVGGGPAEGVCGDGIVDVGENCDDGNTLDGDGCSADCWYVEGGTGGTGMGAGGGPATGGSAGMAGMPGDGTCSTEIIEDPEECSDNDVFLGRAYERCVALGRALVAVRFNDPCSDNSSHSVEIDCCVRAGSGAAGAGGGGGTGGGERAGAGGSS